MLTDLNQSPASGRGMCERAIGLRLRAGRQFACLSSCHAALSLTLVRCCGSARPVARCRRPHAVRFALGYLVARFLIKAFQRIRCPIALSVAISWRLRSPSSRSSSRRAVSPASLVDVLPALPSHLLRPVLRRALARCLLGLSALPYFVCHLCLSSRAILLACRSAFRPSARLPSCSFVPFSPG